MVEFFLNINSKFRVGTQWPEAFIDGKEGTAGLPFRRPQLIISVVGQKINNECQRWSWRLTTAESFPRGSFFEMVQEVIIP